MVEDKVIRCAGYDRVSTLSQSDPTKSSLDSQKAAITNFVAGMVGHEIIGFYEDVYSGGTLQRPALQQMIADGKAGKFDKVVFKRMTRFGRNTLDILTLFKRFEDEMHINLVSIDEFFDTSTGTGRLIRTVLAAIAEYEREVIRGQLKDAVNRKLDKGLFAGGSLVYGSEWVKKPDGSGEIVAVPEERRVLRMIYDYLVFGGLSLKAIGRELDKQGISTPSKKRNRKNDKWSSSSLSSILKNDGLFGDFVAQKTKWTMIDGKNTRLHDRPRSEWKYVKNPEPAFTKAEVLEMQRILRSKRGKVKLKHPEEFLLKDIVSCGCCGARLSVISGWKSKRTGQTHYYYGCFWSGNTSETELKWANKTRCPLPYTDCKRLDDFIWNRLVSGIVTEPNFADVFLDVTSYEKQEKAILSEINTLRKVRQPIDRSMERLLDAIEAKVLPVEVIRERYAQHDRNKAELDEKIATKEAQLQKIRSSISSVQQFKTSRLQLLSNMTEAADKLSRRTFAEKRSLIKYLYQDVKIELKLITMERALQIVPDDTAFEEQGIFFGKGTKTGTYVNFDGLIEPARMLNLLENLENPTGDSHIISTVYGGNAFRQHGLAGPGRPDHDEIVTPGSSNLHGPFHVLLAADIAEISLVGFRLEKSVSVDLARGNGRKPAKGFHQLIERLDRVNVNSFNHRCFSRVLHGKKNPPETVFLCGHCHGEGSFDGPDEPVQRKLPQDQVLAVGILGHNARRSQNSHGHGKIKPAPLFLHIRRSQVHRDPIRRKVVARILDRSLNPLLAFPNSPFREADR